MPDEVTNAESTTATVSGDVLQGAGQIARFLGINRRSVYYYIERRELPVYRFGSQIFARRSTLLRHIEKLEASGGRQASVGSVAASPLIAAEG